MKRYLLSILSVFACFVLAYGQSGIWSGKLEVMGNKLPIVFHFDENQSTMDSPAQGAKGIPVEVSRGEEGEITIAIPLVRASFQGKYENGRIVGTLKQNGLSLPLVLTSGEDKPKRPQTPQGPAPYREEEVSFSNGDATLKGTLTMPEVCSRETPVVIMVTGSGQQNRDEEVFDHKPFAVIADALAREGIATLRYDDRGFGESTGDARNCTTEDLMKDAESGINLLRERFNKIGVLGHSEGGTIALMLAADGKADFIISLAGMVVSGKETLVEQNRRLFAERGIPDNTAENYCRILALILENDESWQQQLEASDLAAGLKQNLRAVAGQMNTPYMRYFAAMDMRGGLKDITCPVLALNGTKDTQVFYESNLSALKNGLPGNSHNKIQEAEGLNHLFQHCMTGSVMEYGTIEETISPEILQTIIEWIKSL